MEENIERVLREYEQCPKCKSLKLLEDCSSNKITCSQCNYAGNKKEFIIYSEVSEN